MIDNLSRVFSDFTHHTNVGIAGLCTVLSPPDPVTYQLHSVGSQEHLVLGISVKRAVREAAILCSVTQNKLRGEVLCLKLGRYVNISGGEVDWHGVCIKLKQTKERKIETSHFLRFKCLKKI